MFVRLQGCQSLMTQSLTKAWDAYLISERHAPSMYCISYRILFLSRYFHKPHNVMYMVLYFVNGK